MYKASGKYASCRLWKKLCEAGASQESKRDQKSQL